MVDHATPWSLLDLNMVYHDTPWSLLGANMVYHVTTWSLLDLNMVYHVTPWSLLNVNMVYNVIQWSVLDPNMVYHDTPWSFIKQSFRFKHGWPCSTMVLFDHGWPWSISRQFNVDGLPWFTMVLPLPKHGQPCPQTMVYYDQTMVDHGWAMVVRPGKFPCA